MSLSPLEAYDLIRFADLLQDKLALAANELSMKRGLKLEKDWMAAASEVLKVARESTTGLLERARSLPELEEVRGEFAAEFQAQWVDALERLLAGITFHVGNRDPMIEALFPHQKLPALRKAPQDAAQDFAKDFNRRLKSSYVTRMLGEPNFAFAGPVLEIIKAAAAKWQSAYKPEEIPEEALAELRKELVAAGKRIDLAVRQARLLAEAALAPVAGMFEEQGLAAKPKRRTPKSEKPEKKDEEAAAEESKAAGETGDPEGDEKSKPSKADEKAEAKADKAEAKAEKQEEKPKAEKPKKKKAANGVAEQAS